VEGRVGGGVAVHGVAGAVRFRRRPLRRARPARGEC